MYRSILAILHIIGAGLVLGSVGVAAGITFKEKLTKTTIKYLEIIKTLAFIGVTSQLVTGILFFLRKPDEYKNSPIFWIKISLYLFDGFLAERIIDRKVKSFKQGETAKEKTINRLYLLQFLIIVLIISLGVLL